MAGGWESKLQRGMVTETQSIFLGKSEDSGKLPRKAGSWRMEQNWLYNEDTKPSWEGNLIKNLTERAKGKEVAHQSYH